MRQGGEQRDREEGLDRARQIQTDIETYRNKIMENRYILKKQRDRETK